MLVILYQSCLFRYEKKPTLYVHPNKENPLLRATQRAQIIVAGGTQALDLSLKPFHSP